MNSSKRSVAFVVALVAVSGAVFVGLALPVAELGFEVPIRVVGGGAGHGVVGGDQLVTDTVVGVDSGDEGDLARADEPSLVEVGHGREIGREQNRHQRHRMLAVIDRTNLTVAVDARGAAPQIVPGEPGQRPMFIPSLTASTSVVPAAVTAFTHMLKPI